MVGSAQFASGQISKSKSKSVAIGVFQNTARFGIALPRVAMALWAESGRRHRILGLETAAPTLNRKDCHPFFVSLEGIVSGKVAVRTEPFHTDGHNLTLLQSRLYCLKGTRLGGNFAKLIPRLIVEFG